MTALQSLIELPKLSKQNNVPELKETRPYFRPKNVNFHSCFQTWSLKFIPLGRNSAKEFAFFFFFLIHLKLKQQTRSYTPVIPSKTIPDSKPKWAKCISVFNRPKKRKSHTLWGGTYLHGFHKETSPGRKSKYLRNSVRGPGCPLNASYGRETKHFEKERIGLKGW